MRCQNSVYWLIQGQRSKDHLLSTELGIPWLLNFSSLHIPPGPDRSHGQKLGQRVGSDGSVHRGPSLLGTGRRSWGKGGWAPRGGGKEPPQQGPLQWALPQSRGRAGTRGGEKELRTGSMRGPPLEPYSLMDWDPLRLRG